MMKKIVFIVILILIGFLNVNASPGTLKNYSIKTCPNGKIYGYHGDDNHWHEATAKQGKRGISYYPKGSAIYHDPCPYEGTKSSIKTNQKTTTTKRVVTTTSNTTTTTTTTTKATTTTSTTTTTTITTSTTTPTTTSSTTTLPATSNTTSTKTTKYHQVKSLEKESSNNANDFFTGLLTVAIGGGIITLIKAKKR